MGELGFVVTNIETREYMMSSAPSVTGGSGKPEGNITFSSFNLPVLDDGLYKIEVQHSFQADAASPCPNIPPQVRYFAALGPRYTLDPAEIAAQFPPPKTSGRYHDVLPHIVFKRAILPWERQPWEAELNPTKPVTPWLTLVLVTHDEMIGWRQACGDAKLLTVRTDTLANVCQDAQANNIVFPRLSDIARVPGESTDESVNFIDIPEPLLQLLLPMEDELPFLSHVRQSADTPPAGGNPKFPALMCNRLPQAGQENTILLLSLELRSDVYSQLALAPALTGEPAPVAAARLYRFAVLHNWRFASVTPKLTFEQLLEDANRFTSGTRGAFCLAPVNDPNADPFLEKGYVPLEHQARQSNRMVSWYRGPFLPGIAADTTALPAPSSLASPDALLRIHAGTGMFDVSYASAWNIGRSIMLENKRISQALFEWKRACVRARKADVPSHLPCRRAVLPALPQMLSGWFVRLGRVEQVPFNYLVPDPRLLPAGSIAFFSVDPVWVQLLLRGAFAIGDIASSDEDIEDALFTNIPAPPALSGFLLRSPVVAGWPHLLVDGFDAEPPSGTTPPFEINGVKPLAQHRYQLGKDTLLCLFEGEVKSVEIYLQPETIHFGIDYLSADPDHGVPTPCYLKRLRDANGDPVQPTTTACGADRSSDFEVQQWVRIPFRFADTGVIDIDALAGRFGSALPGTSISPAEFAYQMVEGVPKFRFTSQV